MEKLTLKTKNAPKSKEKPSFHEGGEAQQKFERTMKALFQAPKSDSKKAKKGKD